MVSSFRGPTRNRHPDMHELSLCYSLLAEIDRCLDDFPGPVRVTSIRLQVGRLRAVFPETMKFCFAAVSCGTRAEGAEISIEEIPVSVRCPSCREVWELLEISFLCPRCDQPLEVLSGKELYLRAIEVETEEVEMDGLKTNGLEAS